MGNGDCVRVCSFIDLCCEEKGAACLILRLLSEIRTNYFFQRHGSFGMVTVGESIVFGGTCSGSTKRVARRDLSQQRSANGRHCVLALARSQFSWADGELLGTTDLKERELTDMFGIRLDAVLYLKEKDRGCLRSRVHQSISHLDKRILELGITS
jgi:hypothetical protein